MSQSFINNESIAQSRRETCRMISLHRSKGHSLIETLVVVAIIGILMATATPSLVRALRMAKRVAVVEGKRQENLVRDLDGAPDITSENARQLARAEYRKEIDGGKVEFAVTQLLYKVSSDQEFIAYWYTLIDLREVVPIEYGPRGGLLARDPEGNEYELPPLSYGIEPGDNTPAPLAWDFFATRMAHSAIGDLGASVLYSDGQTEYIQYPGAFPMTRTVAELSQLFMDEVYPELE